ncbi:hypothetical protein BJ875DRAFT_483296 [Amylocarpus encephaloides]|uniref:Uncharacterized protein n=1 Tax=Amylocarpus encephaloides TaxID=45428 RepID=A0A9P8C6K4_9HELO|nr:hypothetical protein BJ875DRAFT_483296 [Amylocarpus encephaloides]
MDFLKKAQDAMGGSSSNQQQKPQQQEGQTGQPAGEKQDYGDKAFGFLAKKSGHNVDDKTGEKITDGARGVYEKMTGNKVDPKYSN